MARTPIYVDARPSHWTVNCAKLSDHHVLILWADEHGQPLSSTVVDSADLLMSLDDSLADLAVGEGILPEEVRVPSEAVASGWGKLFGDMVFVPNASEDVDKMLDYLVDNLGAPVPLNEHAAASPSGPDIDDLRESFEAAALFYKKKPWKITNGSALMITDSSAGVEGTVDLMGGKRPGFMFFDDEAFVEYADLLLQLETGQVLTHVPPNISVSFGAVSSVPRALSTSIRLEGWPIVSRNAFPTVIVFDRTGPVGPSRSDYVTSTFLLHALAALTSVKAKVHKALSAGEAASWTLHFEAPDGGMEWVTIATARGVSEAFLELSEACGFDKDDPDSWRALTSELIRRFSESPYAKGVVPEHCRLVSEIGINYCGKPIVDLDGDDLVEIMLDWIPKKAMISRADAEEMVKANRAFFEFQWRVYELPFARECMEVSGDALAEDMGDALEDPRGFGMAKSIISAGATAGYDIESEEGLHAWMKSLEGKPLPDSVSLPGFPGGPGALSRSKPKPKLKLVRSPKTKSDRNKAKSKRKRKKR